MNLIATIDKNWAIGKQGQPLVNIPEDIKLFRMETAGKAAIMGRKTYEQIPDRMTLMDRFNIVLTRDTSYKKEGIVVVHSVEEALEKASAYKSEDVYVIGGESVFKQFLPYCDVAHITSVDYKYDADAYFPNLDKLPEWRVTQMSEEHTYFNLCYEFKKYCRMTY